MSPPTKHAVHITSVHYPFDPRIFHKQLRTLSEYGYETTLIAHHEKTTERDGIQVISAGTVESRTERWSNLPKIFWKARQADAEIYHLHDPELLPIGYLLSLTTNGKIVYDVHENYTDAIRVRDWLPGGLTPILTTLFPKIQSTIIDSFDLIITADDSTNRQLSGRTNTTIRTIRNLPRLDDIKIEEVDVTRSNEYILAYVGGLDRERGLMDMLKVTEQLRNDGVDVGLWLIGPFQDADLEQKARAFMASADLQDAVELFGYIDYDEIFSYLSLADIGLLLVDEERFRWNIPTKFFEYLYCGLPVVLTSVPSLDPYRSPEYSLSVSNDDLDSTVSSIRYLLADNEKRTEMGIKGQKKILSEYNWEIEENKLLDAYHDL